MNVLVVLNCLFVDMIWCLGVDVVSFGGIKNGCMGVEVVVIFDLVKVWEFELWCKCGVYFFFKLCYLLV